MLFFFFESALNMYLINVYVIFKKNCKEESKVNQDNKKKKKNKKPKKRRILISFQRINSNQIKKMEEICEDVMILIFKYFNVNERAKLKVVLQAMV